MPDAPEDMQNLFEHQRPVLVVGEGTTTHAIEKDVVAEFALGSVTEVKLEMSNEFENQFLTQYVPRIFPATLKYDCGGADYMDLFSSWCAEDDNSIESAVRTRWRRLAGEAVLTPGAYAQMLATRPEKQIAGDWLLVPAAQNLHWRWMVLRSAQGCSSVPGIPAL